ncbi:M56 family metallopeptidase [Sphingomonas sp. DG1-23]|uniref:M56 family metallopeptidase n=1 Tax=Sphingomonas sp. DG1-23 TaxID=3068316 RepID=UPI00273EBD1E|nr:M56 family metallopeptidase [Sphingomonas sp. DG1-23]MDP5279299.1 M56 family metallopeptidase [Sphingomonas sp. DG1-23]
MLAILVDLGWKSALIAGAALLANRAMQRRPASERVFLLRTAIAMLLALPVAAALVPALDLAILPALTPVQPVPVRALAPVVPPAPRADLDAATLATALYIAGTAALLLHLGAGIFTLAGWTRRGTPVADPQWRAALLRATAGLPRPVRLLESRDVVSPLSWGAAPAWILVDRDSLARREQADAVIAHEMAHIRRFDWPMLIAVRITVALFWGNPLAWLVARALAHENEIAADEVAMLRVARLDYAQALLAFATAPAGHRAATGMALWPGALKDRISRIIEGSGPRRRSRVLLAAILVCGSGATPTLAALQFVRATDRESTVSSAWAPVPPATTHHTAPPAEVRITGTAPAAWRAPQPAANFQPSSEASPMVVTGPVVVAAPTPVPVTLAPIVAPEDQAEARREMEEERQDAEETAREVRLERREIARELRAAAADMRRQADELDRIANEPGQPPSLREGHASGSKSLRDNAAKMEAQAAGLEKG